MISEMFEYNDLDGKPVQKEWYFSLDRAEIAEMKIRHDGPDQGEGSLADYLDRIVKEQDNNKLLDNFQAILKKSVAIRPAGTNYLKKGQEIVDEFVGGGAYEYMFMKMLGDAVYAANLINGIIPKDMAEEAAKREAEEKQYTDADLLAMTDDAFFTAAGGTNPMRWEPRFLTLAARRKNAA
jgi:hypothetical protein